MDSNIIQGVADITHAADAYTGTLSVGVNIYFDRAIYLCNIVNANATTTPTLNLNGIGAQPIVANGGGALTVGQLSAGSWRMFVLDVSAGPEFVLIN